jgi:hypothetical protein
MCRPAQAVVKKMARLAVVASSLGPPTPTVLLLEGVDAEEALLAPNPGQAERNCLGAECTPQGTPEPLLACCGSS